MSICLVFEDEEMARVLCARVPIPCLGLCPQTRKFRSLNMSICLVFEKEKKWHVYCLLVS